MKIDTFIFLTKEEKALMKYLHILEKVSNIIKNKFNSELIYTKNHKRRL